jgi:hypothetical protein
LELTLVNADPFADLIVQGPNSIHYLKGDATGQFVLTDSIAPGAPGTLASTSAARVGLDAGFLNTDFASDLVTVAPGTDELLVFVGDSSDELVTPARYASGADEPIVARVADVIGSPIPDVVVGHADGTVTWFEGLGDGTLTFRSDLTVTGLDPIFDLTIGDFDGEGDNDVAVSGANRSQPPGRRQRCGHDQPDHQQRFFRRTHRLGIRDRRTRGDWHSGADQRPGQLCAAPRKRIVPRLAPKVTATKFGESK